MTLFWVSLSFLAGIVLASQISLTAWRWSGIAVLSFAFLIFLRRVLMRQRAFPALVSSPVIFILPSVLFLGAANYQFHQPAIDAFHIAFYNDRNYDLLVTGTVAEPPDYRDRYTNLRINTEAVDTGSGNLPVSGLVLVRVPANEEYEYGERLRFRGQLKTPPEDEEFSYRDYLARSNVHAYMPAAEATRLPGRDGTVLLTLIYQFKTRLIKNTYRLFQDPEASLFAGILFGVDTGLPAALQQAFKNTGTAHIIAISGFNIAIIAGVFHSIFRAVFGARWGAFAAILAVFFYAFLVGGDASVLRAAVMGSMSLAAALLGRKQWMIGSLFFTAAVMAMFNPLLLWDVGFQLSFLATLGLILYAEPLSQYTDRFLSKISQQDHSTLLKILNENIMLTLAAQWMTFPIMAYHFHRISLISFVANPFILPVQPAVMILGGLSVFVSLVVFPLGQFLAWMAWGFAAYTIRMVEWFSQAPNGVIVFGDLPLWSVFAIYAALLAVTLNWSALQTWLKSASASLRAAAWTTAFTSLFVCMMLVWSAAAKSGDGRLHILFLEAGSASAILIQTPEGRNILINGGASASDLSSELGRRLPLFSRRLDWLIVAATGEQDLAALPRVLERYTPEQVLWSGNTQASFSSRKLDALFAAGGIPVIHAEAGQRLELGENSFIQVQAEGPRGSVLFIQHQDFRAFLPIGPDRDMLTTMDLEGDIGKVNLVLLADAGYGPSNPPEFFDLLRPQLVILSVAPGDPDGLPHPEVLNALEGYSLLRTDENGWIDVSTDGSEMHVTVERGE